jgi:hypothetical protein
MTDFDPLFDDDDLSPILGLALPPVVPPVVPHAHGGAHFLSENVGTIALPGLHDRIEQLPVTSSTSTSSTSTTPQSSSQSLPQRKPRSRAGKGNAAQGKRVRKPKTLAPRKLPGPYKPETPTEQILANLAKDPNVLPLLQHIVEHIFRTQLSSAPPAAPPVASTTGTTNQRPTKRRRLYRVPAGAEYWPQPFPFREGEGPVHYRETWQMRHMIVLLKALVKGLRNQKRNNSQTILERKVSIQPTRKPVRRRRPTLPHAASPSSATSPSIVQTPLIDDTTSHAQVNAISQAPDDFLASSLDLAIPPLPMPGHLDATLDRLLALFAVNDTSITQGASEDRQVDLNINVDALTGTNDISQLFYTTDASTGPQLFEWDRWFESSNTLLSQLSETGSTSNSGTGSLATPEISWFGHNADLPTAMEIDGTVGAIVGFEKQKAMDLIGESDLQQLLNGELPFFNYEIFDTTFMDPNIAESVQTETITFPPPFAVPPEHDARPFNQAFDPLAAFISSIPTANSTQLQHSPLHTAMAMEVDHPASLLPFPSLDATLEISPVAPIITPQPQPQPQPKPIPLPWSSIPGAIPVSDSTLARRAQILRQAKGLRAQLEQELEGTKLHRWQTLMEHSVLSAVLVRGRKELAARKTEAATAKGSKRK